jgi:hypothetical protein
MRILSQAEQFPQRIAAHFPDPPHRPHDWEEGSNYDLSRDRPDLTDEQKAQTYHEWNPSHVEGGHVQYHIYPSNDPSQRGRHNVNFEGPWKGHRTIEDGSGNTMDINDYDFLQGQGLGLVDHPDQGKALAEKHFQDNYLDKANPLQGDQELDLDSLTKNHGVPGPKKQQAPDPFGPAPIDDDYGSIF